MDKVERAGMTFIVSSTLRAKAEGAEGGVIDGRTHGPQARSQGLAPPRRSGSDVRLVRQPGSAEIELKLRAEISHACGDPPNSCLIYKREMSWSQAIGLAVTPYAGRRLEILFLVLRMWETPILQSERVVNVRVWSQLVNSAR